MHIEMGECQPSSVSSDVCICAGDIGLLSELDALAIYFDDIRKNTDEIIYVLGNHEFYYNEYHNCLKIAEDFCKEHGIHLLDEALGTENLILDGVSFWGSTLWTDFNNNDWFAKNKVGNNFNDFHVILDDPHLTSDVTQMKNFSAESSRIINTRTRKKINWDADVVISHHSPVVTKHRRFQLNDLTYGFCNTGLDQQIQDSAIKYWVSGHTHDNHCIDFNGTTLLSNQQGYPLPKWDKEKYEDCGGFDPNLLFEIKT